MRSPSRPTFSPSTPGSRRPAPGRWPRICCGGVGSARLAQRSAEAAKEIKGLIYASTAQVSKGVELVTQTGEALGRIEAKVLEINTVVTDIAAGVQEQAAALKEVNSATNQMDQVTQQNAAMAEQTTAAGHSLSEQSEKLTSLIGQFRLPDGGEEHLRRELKAVAPHAFQEHDKPQSPPRRAGRTGRSRARIAPAQERRRRWIGGRRAGRGGPGSQPILEGILRGATNPPLSCDPLVGAQARRRKMKDKPILLFRNPASLHSCERPN